MTFAQQLRAMNIIGKTIKEVAKLKMPQYDDAGWLRLEFDDGSSCIIEAWYGSFTGESLDEYPARIDIVEDRDGFIAAPPEEEEDEEDSQ